MHFVLEVLDALMLLGELFNEIAIHHLYIRALECLVFSYIYDLT